MTLVANIPRPGREGPGNILSVIVRTDVLATLDLGAPGAYSISASGRMQVHG